MSMKNKWVDPAKLPPNPETLNMTADWDEFTDLMKKIVNKPKPAYRVPADS